MSRTARVAFVLLFATRAEAYTLLTEQQNGHLVRIHWPAGAQPIRLSINQQTGPQLPNITPDSDPLGALGRALSRWPAASAVTLQRGTTAVADAGKDGVNVLSFVDSTANRQVFEMAGGAVGITLVFFSNDTITEADILFNPAMQFTTTLDTDAALFAANLQDIEATATHELGHFIGLHHSGVEAATMWPIVSVFQRDLDADDIAGARTLYPLATPHGTIRGRVTVDGAAAFGAQVVALAANGTVAASALSLPDGTYAIESLPPDTYTVYVEPLDGPQVAVPDLACVRFGNLSGAGIYNNATLTTTFPTTFAGDGAPTAIELEAADTMTVDFPLASGVNAVNPTVIGPATVDNSQIAYSVGEGPLGAMAGGDQWITLGGPNLDQVSAAGIGFAGPDIVVDPSSRRQLSIDCGGTSLPVLVFRTTIAADAAPGSRTILLTAGDHVSAMTGALVVLGPATTPTPTPCLGDCDHSSEVTVDELLTLVSIALGTTDLSACADGDANGDHQITVDEILTAVSNALNGCPTVNVAGKRLLFPIGGSA